jgi:hypothetical protein
VNFLDCQGDFIVNIKYLNLAKGLSRENSLSIDVEFQTLPIFTLTDRSLPTFLAPYFSNLPVARIG